LGDGEGSSGEGGQMQPNWETEIDTPATIAVIGAGPIGLEAALYGRFLGYFVQVFDAGKVAHEFLQWHQTPLLPPFHELSTSLGRAAIEAQGEAEPLPPPDARLTSRELVDRYLVPLAKTDLLYENMLVHSRVTSVSRMRWRRDTAGEFQDRADDEFRLVIHSKNRGWYTVRADIVLDASGCSDALPLGPGGGLAVGEWEEAGMIPTCVPQLPSARDARYGGKHTLVVGSSPKALASILALVPLLEAQPETRVTWAVPLDPDCTSVGEQLQRTAARSQLGRELVALPAIQAAAASNLERLGAVPTVGVERLVRSARGVTATLQLGDDSSVEVLCDELVAAVGDAPNWEHVKALAIGSSPQGNLPLRPADPERPAAVDQLPQCGVNAAAADLGVLTREPHYYVLGSKSYGLACERFQLSDGYQQIRQAYAYIGGRANLDLYQQFAQRQA
jgi:hypothetical protein